MPLNPPIRHWQGRVVWIVGASSGIGRATAAALHRAGARVIVSARQATALAEFEREHPGAIALPMDATAPQAARQALARIAQSCGQVPDLVLYCAGHYKAQRADAYDLQEMRKHLAVNYEGVLHWLDAVLPALLQAGRGHISLVGSVAGYRGLPMSLAYGPTKAALNNLAECLYLDLHPRGLGVSIVNPGFVDTPLTAQNAFAMPQLITPEEAAQEIIAGWAQGRFEMNFPRRFTFWMRLLRHLPDTWFFAAVRRVTRA
ncbi:MAG: SDR family NAD(P)-dependent oxidoreductase [Proteobacteria bacterium]|uniref:SDR family NAD(P)-dependent oxidoreductase n=1 Tax=Aquabacterium sp. TaxID=1872578 RepID=UPI0035C69864|nr:SDR family NAD(P)-dependent oxidoreductase [Pseudomonadota bacterium]